MSKRKTGMDLKKLGVKELAALQADIQSEMVRKKQEQKREVVNKVKALLAEHGMTLDDLPGRSASKGSKGGKGSVAPKYRNPKDPSQTWTGRGRKPRWVADHLEKGGKIETLAI